MIDINESIKKAEKEIGKELTEDVKQAVNALGKLFNLITLNGKEDKKPD